MANRRGRRSTSRPTVRSAPANRRAGLRLLVIVAVVGLILLALTSATFLGSAAASVAPS